MSMNRKVRFFLLPLMMISLLTTVAWRHAYAAEDQPVPSFNIPSLSGKNLSSKQFKGRVSLLTVWGSWCGACRAEHKTLMNIQNHYHIPMYSIAYKDDPSSTKAYLQKVGNPFITTGLDNNGAVGSALGIYGTPETYIIDKNGIIRYEYVGALTMSVWQDEMLPIIKKYSS